MWSMRYWIKQKTDPNFKFDEIRIELARELKKNASERAEMTKEINQAKGKNEKIVETIRKDFGILNPTRNDIVKYKLYQELALMGIRIYTPIPKSIIISFSVKSMM